MRYLNFYINNFKGISELHLALDNIPNSEVITLVGINESGKTTILDALETFYAEKPLEKAYEFIPKSKQFNFTGEILIQAVLVLSRDDKEQIKKLIENAGLVFVELEETVIVDKKYICNDSKVISFLTETHLKATIKRTRRSQPKALSETDPAYNGIAGYIIESLPKVIYYRNFLFNFPSRIYLESGKQKSDQEINITYRSVLQDILDSIAIETSSGPLNINNQIVERIRSNTQGDKEALNQIITRIGEKITRVVFEAWDKIFTSTNKEITLTSGIDIETDECYIEIRLKQGSQNYQISERSLGFKWFFTFLLFTEFRKNRNEDKGQTLFLLDEPASNLHSTAQTKLLETFGNLTGEKCRLLYTTHSHHLINPKWLACAHIVMNSALSLDSEDPDFDTDQTNISTELYKRYMASSTKQQSYFQPILDALEYQPSKLEDVPNIVIVEGKNDYYTLKYISEIILKKSSELNFYPGAGADKDENIIRCYSAWDRDFAILLDADRGGKTAKARYLTLLGSIIKDKIFTLEDVDIDFSGLPTENLFSEAEQLEIINNSFPDESTYDKAKFNTAMQQLYIDGTPIELLSETTEKFEKVFKFLEGK